MLVGACRADLVRGSTRYGLSMQRLYGGTLTIQEDAGVCCYFWVEGIWNVINLIKSRWFELKNKQRKVRCTLNGNPCGLSVKSNGRLGH
jgi:hypothetical protein